jgi:hypothetical protein
VVEDGACGPLIFGARVGRSCFEICAGEASLDSPVLLIDTMGLFIVEAWLRMRNGEYDIREIKLIRIAVTPNITAQESARSSWNGNSSI